MATVPADIVAQLTPQQKVVLQKAPQALVDAFAETTRREGLEKAKQTHGKEAERLFFPDGRPKDPNKKSEGLGLGEQLAIGAGGALTLGAATQAGTSLAKGESVFGIGGSTPDPASTGVAATNTGAGLAASPTAPPPTPNIIGAEASSGLASAPPSSTGLSSPPPTIGSQGILEDSASAGLSGGGGSGGGGAGGVDAAAGAGTETSLQTAGRYAGYLAALYGTYNALKSASEGDAGGATQGAFTTGAALAGAPWVAAIPYLGAAGVSLGRKAGLFGGNSYETKDPVQFLNDPVMEKYFPGFSQLSDEKKGQVVGTVLASGLATGTQGVKGKTENFQPNYDAALARFKAEGDPNAEYKAFQEASARIKGGQFGLDIPRFNTYQPGADSDPRIESLKNQEIFKNRNRSLSESINAIRDTGGAKFNDQLAKLEQLNTQVQGIITGAPTQSPLVSAVSPSTPTPAPTPSATGLPQQALPTIDPITAAIAQGRTPGFDEDPNNPGRFIRRR